MTHLFFRKSLVIVDVHFLKSFYAAWTSSHMQKLHLKDQGCIGWHRIYGIKQKSIQKVNKEKSRTTFDQMCIYIMAHNKAN